MINKFHQNSNIEKFVIIIFPLLLITGPALPDITAVLISIYFLLFKIKKNFKQIISSYWIISFIALWLWFLIISFFAYNQITSFSDGIIFFRFIVFTVAIYFIFSEIDFKFLKILFYISLLIFSFVTLDTLFQFYNYDSALGFKGDIFGTKPEGLEGRLSGPFKDLIPGAYLARFYFLVLLIFFINHSLNKKINNKVIIFFVLALSLSTIYFTGERMAISIALFSFGIVILFIKNNKVYFLSIILISFSFIFLNTIFHSHFNDYTIINSSAKHEGLLIQKKFPCSENTNEICYKEVSRQPKFTDVLFNFKDSAYGSIYITSLKMWSDYPITGIGLNNFNLVCKTENKYLKYHKEFGCTTHPHNLYIQALVETGIIGLLLFINLVCSIFYKILLTKNYNIKIFGFVIILTIFWPIMSTGSFLKNWNMIFISFLIGLTMALCEFSSTKKSEFKNTN